MKKIHFVALIGCSILMSLILIILYFFSPLTKEIPRGDFERIFVKEDALQQTAILDLGVNSYYISGITSHTAYLSNYTSPFHMIVSNMDLTDSQKVQIKLIGIDSIRMPRKFITSVDSPLFFIYNGIMPEVLRGNVHSWKAKKIIPEKGYYFVDALPIGSSSLALRSFSMSQRGFELGKLNAYDSPYFEMKYGLLERQLDGTFDVDGEMSYSKELNRLVYLYTYRNQYMVMDTNLNLIYQRNTIDSTDIAQMKVSKLDANGSSVLASLTFASNSKSCVSENYLFIQSNLPAKNDDREKFSHSSVIDMYDLTKGIYKHSFYIPFFQGHKLSDFKIINTQLCTISDRYLISYNIDPVLLKNYNDTL